MLPVGGEEISAVCAVRQGNLGLRKRLSEPGGYERLGPQTS
jgi:hypothetical protein